MASHAGSRIWSWGRGAGGVEEIHAWQAFHLVEENKEPMNFGLLTGLRGT